uniref:Uncharacterized protein n=1 Tax=Strongyloides venezuelensis TaxID=75913 RepID=A0A0K0FCX3_STRVS
MIINIFKTSQVPVLTHALTFIKFMTVKSEGEDFKKIDLPLAPVPPSRPKMKDEQNIPYSINLKKISKNNRYWWYC